MLDLSKIYNEIVPILHKYCENQEQKKTVEIAYQKYLKETYEAVIQTVCDTETVEFVQLFIDNIIDEEKVKWNGRKLDEVIHEFETDEAYLELQRISYDLFSKAREIKQKALFIHDEVEYKNMKELIMKLYGEVKKWNKDDISDLLSETLLDLDFIYEKSEYQSLRLGRELLPEDIESHVMFGEYTPFSDANVIFGEGDNE